MDLKRTWTIMLVFLAVAVFIWVGFNVYFSVRKIEINPNAASYTQPLAPKFDTTAFDNVVEKIKLLPVQPSEFQSLTTPTD